MHELTDQYGVRFHNFADDTHKHKYVQDIDSTNMAVAMDTISALSKSYRLKQNK